MTRHAFRSELRRMSCVVSTEGFESIGSKISQQLKLPTVIVQEGGYLCPELGENMNSFIRGIES